jgi:hypothetical protein
MEKEFLNKKDLENLTRDFCDVFLSIKNKTDEHLDKDIGLYGTDRNILVQLKDSMEKYFEGKGKCVSICLEKKGYAIDVGYFLKYIPPQEV